MYYPWDIQRFREALDAGTRGTFEGVPIAQSLVRIAAGSDSGCEVEPAETRAMVGPDRVFGSPEQASCLDAVGSYALSCPPRRLYQAKEARIIGSATVLGADGALYCPDLVETEALLDQAVRSNTSNRQAFVLRRESGDRASAFHFCSGQDRRIDASVLFLPNLEPGNYGSFLFRVLPHILAAGQMGVAFDAIVTSDRSHWLFEAFRLAGLPMRPVFLAEEVYGATFRQLLFFNDFVTEGFFPTSIAAALKRLGRQSGADARTVLYVSRTLALTRTPRYRRLTNELTLERQARDRGCAIVYPETLTLADQIRLFAGARRIIGPSGSGMLNAAFAPDGGRVLDLESFHVTVRQHAKIYASSGQNYAFAFGRFETDDPREATVRSWRMPADVFAAGLEWVLDGT